MTDLSRFRVGAEQPEEADKSAPVFTWFGSLLAFDQTLSGCGYVRVVCHKPGALIITHAGLFKADHVTAKGNPGNLKKADYIFDCVRGLIADVMGGVDAVVHESPPSGGGRLMRPESSLMAATCIRNAAAVHGVQVLEAVPPRTAKKRFTGDPNADKKDVHAAIGRMVDLSLMKPNNENVRDALAVAIVAAERNTRGRST